MQVREGQTHQHYLDRVSQEPNVGLQDVIVEGWGQHGTTSVYSTGANHNLKQRWVCGERGGGIRGMTGDDLGGTKDFRRRPIVSNDKNC